ncbi:unnamed protein product, partial [Vitis vinifera]
MKFSRTQRLRLILICLVLQIRPQHTLFLEPPSLILVPSKRLGQDWE